MGIVGATLGVDDEDEDDATTAVASNVATTAGQTYSRYTFIFGKVCC